MIYTLGTIVKGITLDSYFLQIANLIFSGVFDVFEVTPFPGVFVANFEYLFVSWVHCEQRYITATVAQQKRNPI